MGKAKRVREKTAAEKVEDIVENENENEVIDEQAAATEEVANNEAATAPAPQEKVKAKKSGVKTYAKLGGGILQLSRNFTVSGVEGTTFEWDGAIPEAFKNLVREV